MATVKVETNAAGDHAVGVEVEGVFVPLASVSAARIAQLVERGNDLQAKADAGDELAQEALDNDFGGKASKKSESKAKGGNG